MNHFYPLTICLLSALLLGSCGQKSANAPFIVPLKGPIATGPPPIDKSFVVYGKLLPELIETRVRLSQISVALTRYSARHGGKMPDLSSPQSMQRALIPYLHQDPVGGTAIFRHSVTNKPFVPNPSLSYVVTSKLPNPASTCLVYQALPRFDGTRGVVFADGLTNHRFGVGSFKRVKAKDWFAIKKQSHIP